MFHRTSFITTAFLIVSSFFFVSAVHAQGPGRRGGGMGSDGDGPSQRMMDRLNLTDPQKETIQSLRQTHRDQMRSHREAVQAAREQFRTLMQGDASDADVRAAHERVQESMRILRGAYIEQMLKIRSVLDPNQRKELGRYGGDRGTRGKRGQGNFDMDTF